MTLQERQRRLARECAQAQWDLGGLAYEMAIRDHFRLDVLLRRAARLQELDAELAELRRLRHGEATGEAGVCPSCSAPHSRGAGYCWRCGTTLLSAPGPSAAAATAAIDNPHVAARPSADAIAAPPATP